MLRMLKKLRRSERGNVLIVTALAMPLLIGSAGLAVDTIQWALWKRQLQKAADSAALAAVYAQFNGQVVDGAGGAVWYDVGYPNTSNTRAPNNNRTGYALLSAPTVTPQPATSDYINAYQVQLRMQHSLPFSSMFLASTPIITATATAAGVETAEDCARAQDGSSATGISVGGTVNLTINCGGHTNSRSMEAAVAFGDSTVKFQPVSAVGGLDATDNWGTGTTLLPFTLPRPDPFADVAAPAIPSTCSDQFNDNPSDNQAIWPAVGSSVTVTNNTICLSKFDAKGTVTLRSDTTYIITGDFKANSGANVTCLRCTFIMTNATPSDTGTVDINGSATMNLTAPTSGDYKGILFYSNRGADSSDTSKINGNSGSTFSGAFYFPNQQVEFSGGATATYQCLKLVGFRLKFTGNSSINNNCDPSLFGDRFKGRHVRLVG